MDNPKPLPFGEWRPDIAMLDNQFAFDVENVFPGINSYKPMPSLLPFSATAITTTPPCGLYGARKSDGSWKIYAGSRTALYTWSLSGGWVDVTRLVGGAYSVPATGELWSFAQFGTNLVAVNQNDDIQVIDIEAGANFTALGGTPPKARTV